MEKKEIKNEEENKNKEYNSQEVIDYFEKTLKIQAIGKKEIKNQKNILDITDEAVFYKQFNENKNNTRLMIKFLGIQNGKFLKVGEKLYKRQNIISKLSDIQKTQSEQLEKEIKNLTKENKDLKKANEEIKNLKKKKEDLEKQLKNLKKEKEDLNKLKKEKEQLKKTNEELKNLKEQLKKANEEIKKLNEEKDLEKPIDLTDKKEEKKEENEKKSKEEKKEDIEKESNSKSNKEEEDEQLKEKSNNNSLNSQNDKDNLNLKKSQHKTANFIKNAAKHYNLNGDTKMVIDGLIEKLDKNRNTEENKEFNRDKIWKEFADNGVFKGMQHFSTKKSRINQLFSVYATIKSMKQMFLQEDQNIAQKNEAMNKDINNDNNNNNISVSENQNNKSANNQDLMKNQYKKILKMLTNANAMIITSGEFGWRSGIYLAIKPELDLLQEKLKAFNMVEDNKKSSNNIIQRLGGLQNQMKQKFDDYIKIENKENEEKEKRRDNDISLKYRQQSEIDMKKIDKQYNELNKIFKQTERLVSDMRKQLDEKGADVWLSNLHETERGFVCDSLKDLEYEIKESTKTLSKLDAARKNDQLGFLEAIGSCIDDMKKQLKTAERLYLINVEASLEDTSVILEGTNSNDLQVDNSDNNNIEVKKEDQLGKAYNDKTRQYVSNVDGLKIAEATFNKDENKISNNASEQSLLDISTSIINKLEGFGLTAN